MNNPVISFVTIDFRVCVQKKNYPTFANDRPGHVLGQELFGFFFKELIVIHEIFVCFLLYLCQFLVMSVNFTKLREFFFKEKYMFL